MSNIIVKLMSQLEESPIYLSYTLKTSQVIIIGLRNCLYNPHQYSKPLR